MLLISRLIEKRRREGFKKMLANPKESKKTTNYEVSDTSVRSLSGFILSTPERSTAKSLNITFIRVNMTPEKNKEKKIYR